MKKLFALLAALALALSLAACGQGTEKTELTVFAAASMQETLTEIGKQYMADHEDVEVVFNFDSSGTLMTQIQEGAVCDVFISAGQKQMDQLEEDGLVLAGSRFDLLENKVVLAVPAGNPANIRSYDDLRERLEAGGGRSAGHGQQRRPCGPVHPEDIRLLGPGRGRAGQPPAALPTAEMSRRSPPRCPRGPWTAASSTPPTPFPPA